MLLALLQAQSDVEEAIRRSSLRTKIQLLLLTASYFFCIMKTSTLERPLEAMTNRQIACQFCAKRKSPFFGRIFMRADSHSL